LRLNEEVMSKSTAHESRYPLLDSHQTPHDENAFVDWLVDARPGAACAYYRGHLAYDRDPQQSKLGEFRRRKLTHLADRAMECCERNQVLLVQRRMGKGDFVYLAIRSSAPMIIPRNRQSNSSVRSLCNA
jgi:hypothetical protein